MENQERIDALEEAMNLIESAQYLMDSAIEGTDLEDHYKTYGRCGIDQALGNGNPYDESIDKLIESLMENA